jgi:hypothetical protein
VRLLCGCWLGLVAFAFAFAFASHWVGWQKFGRRKRVIGFAFAHARHKNGIPHPRESLSCLSATHAQANAEHSRSRPWPTP